MATSDLARRLFHAFVPNGSAATSLSDAQVQHEPANFLRHATSLSMTKIADGLIDPKLVLSWLLSHLGAASFFVGLLVPIREAGALLPQLLTASRVQAMAQRKWAWVTGSFGQSAAMAGVFLSAMTLTGWAAGVTICALLAFFAVSRSICSVSYSDVLGKTVDQTRRGAATGTATSLAAGAVVLFALILMSGWGDRVALVLGAIALASVLWFVAALTFSTLWEEAEPGKSDIAPLGQLDVLRRDPLLRRFILVRGLLTATALAPPYIILLGGDAGQATFDRLGPLVLASSIASMISSWVWGRMADRSSRRVLMVSGACGALALLAAVMLDVTGLSGVIWALPAVLFALMVSYHGVRQGRVIYLVDMAPGDQRASYTAISNTVIGVVLLGSGLLGALASIIGPHATLLIFAAMSGAASCIGRSLKEFGI